jgi:hypothetical protein
LLLSGSQPSVRVGFRTLKIPPSYWELMTHENLGRFGKTLADVQSVSYSSHYPGSPYAELPLAAPTHPTIGSGSAFVTFSDGTHATICDIFYEDLNPMKDHCNGQPHWNLERRFMCDVWSKPQFDKHPDYHCIPQSTWIDIISEDNGSPQRAKRLLWK